MRNKIFALLLAAAMLAGSYGTSFAGESGRQPQRPGPGRQSQRPEFGNCGPGRGFGQNHSMRHRGPNGVHRGGERRGFGNGWQEGFGCPMFGQNIADRLDLDKAQRDKLIEVMTNNFRAGLTARMEMREAKNKLEEVRNSDSATAEEIIAANQALGAAAGRLEVAQREAREAIEAILTPEQKEQMKSFRDDSPRHRGRLDGDRGNRGDRSGRGMMMRGDRRGPGGPGGHRGPGGPERDDAHTPSPSR